MNFKNFKEPVTRQFNELAQNPLFCTAVDRDRLWQTYLNSFPAGTNPIFREKTEHDCSCCRQFIKTIGSVVAVINGELKTIWDTEFDDPTYKVVAKAMSREVKSFLIARPFLHYEREVGTDKNYDNDKWGKVLTWEHFHVSLYGSNVMRSDFICPKKDIATRIGEARACYDVLLRSITELTADSIETAQDLIRQGSLYRGEEYRHLVDGLSKLQQEFYRLTPDKRDAFVWLKSASIPESQAKVRNTAIGTLLVDLSDGMDLEVAVRRFEKVMAPANYKRPTALVTKAMVDKARQAVAGLGLESAMERRHARLSDVSVNDVIFADRAARKVMRGDVFDSIQTKNPTPKEWKQIEEIRIDKFVADVVPHAETIEVFIDNQHAGNMVSLIAPKYAHAEPLFKWDNGFSWSYSGEVADSVKEKVKRAGGNVTGDLCCRLAWYNYDDLDLHMVEAPSRYEIFFGNRHQASPCGGRLDVDMNAGHGTTREPVENIFYANHRLMREGHYQLFVHQYRKQEAADNGFEVEIDYLGTVTRMVYEKPVRQGERVVVANIRCDKNGDKEISGQLPSTQASKTIWGLRTQDWHRVSAMMLSPNFWADSGGIGNRHWFFMLDGCLNDGSARGFFNEFLRDELTPHRKVIELVGSKSKVEASADQLSGLGFSSTRKNELLARVRGSFNRTVKVLF